MDSKNNNDQMIYVNGIKWYFRLKGDNGLLSKLSDDEKMSHLIVSFVNPEGKRYFTSFESFPKFIQMMITLPEEKRNFHEVALENRPQKMRFDLDIKKYKYFEGTIYEEVKENDVRMFFDDLIESIVSEFKELGILLDLEKNILVFSSHGKEKWSYHIIIDGYYCDNHRECSELFKKITNRMKSNLSHKENWLDSSIYSANHCLRILGSCKEDKHGDEKELRKKILETKWLNHDKEICFAYAETPRSENHRIILEFERSFLSLTENCYPIPNLVQKENVETKWKDVQVNGDVVDYSFRLYQSLYGNDFTYGGTMANIVMLFRQKPSGCPICDRVHEKENAFLWIKEIYSSSGDMESNVIQKYEIYFDCRRSNGKKIKIGEKVVLDEKKVPKENKIVEKVSRIGFDISDLEDLSRISIKKFKCP
jgi:hypothetical protein